MFYYIYKITNLINNKEYIGAHTTSDMNDGYMGSGKLLKHAFVKYGIENFQKDILCMCDNSSDMYEKERELVTEEYISRPNVYNLKIGGSGGSVKGRKHSDEAKAKIALAMSSRDPDSYRSGFVLSEEQKKKISDAMKISLLGTTKAESHKSNIAKSLVGSKIMIDLDGKRRQVKADSIDNRMREGWTFPIKRKR